MLAKSMTFIISWLICALLGFEQTPTVNMTLNERPQSSERWPQEPKLFDPGVISTGDYEFAPAFMPDSRIIYFVKSTPDFSYWTIVYSQLEKGEWRTPKVAPFSGRYKDGDPFITADGAQFYFISDRPSDPQAPVRFNIWVMNKTANGWGEPKHLGKPINEASQYFPTLAANGTLYFGSTRKGGKGGADLYRSKWADGVFQEPENLGEEINTSYDEYEPLIAPDESFLIFMADGRPEGLGGYDLYISHYENGKWTKARNLGPPINSPAHDYSPKISPDGKLFFWTSTRSSINKSRNKSWTYQELTTSYRKPQNGLGDIYYIDKNVLKLHR